ncbi:MAG TPA: ROK family protein [Bryobacteraceae bacterium]|nr:ROK family protein [Bryobacteraceae bacterium]
MKHVLAVDIGGTKTATAWVDEEGEITHKRKRRSGASLEESVTAIREALTDGDGAPAAVGVIVPGIFDSRTGTAWCPNLWGREQVPLRKALEDQLGLTVVVDNDRTGCVLGESWVGVARGLKDVVFVSIGTGIGVGIVSGGHVVRGAHGIGGSAGWMAVDSDWKEEFARCGGWEALSAGPAVARAYGAADAEAVAAAAKAGERRAIAVLENAARYSGRGVANLVSILNPEMVVMGGGVMHGASEWMLEVIREGMMLWAQPVSARACRVEMTMLGEDAGLLGAAWLAHGEI